MVDDWKETVGHDFTPEEWAKIQRKAERLVMEARPVAETAMTGEADQQANTPTGLKASMLAALERDLADGKEKDARRSAALNELASIDGDIL